MKNQSRRSISRRRVLASGLAALATGPFLLNRARAQTAEKLVLVNWGGAIAAAKTEVFYKPFTKETGIEIMQVPGPDLARTRAQVESKDIEWDLVDGALAHWVPTAERFDLFERIDRSIVPMDRVHKYAARESLLGYYYFSSGIAFPTDRVAEANRPKKWAEFWNLDKFPGRRGMWGRVVETLEVSLIADGVPPSKVYPCDVERAFKALDRIKPHVANWYNQGIQAVVLIERKECDFTHSYASAVRGAVAAGQKVGFSNENNVIGVNWIGVVKGTKKKTAAMRFLEFALRPDRQIAFANAISYAPVISGLYSQVDAGPRQWMPDVTKESNLLLNIDWWAGKEEALEKRFKEWLLT